MADLKLFDSKAGTSSTVQGSDVIFKAPLRLDLLNEYVIMQRRRARQGTHSCLTRAEVSGTGKKPFRQKGTGNARQGTLRGPHQYHGGVAFGPKPRTYDSALPRKVKREAVRVALSQKSFEKKVVVVDTMDVVSGKTKDASAQLKKMGIESALILGNFTDTTRRSFRNLDGVKTLPVEAINVRDLLAHDFCIMTKEALAWCEANLTGNEREKVKVA